MCIEKKSYEPLEMETIQFEAEDVIATSNSATEGPFVQEGQG